MALSRFPSALLNEQLSANPEAEPSRSERRERRSLIAISLLVCGLGANGRLFFELATTHDISHTGCRIHLRTKPHGESALALRMPLQGDMHASPGSHILFQLAWMQPEGDDWAVGAYTLGQADLWTLAFPSRTP